MTTIVAVKKNGIVSIAADTLTTFGNTKLPAVMDSSHDKILHIGESFKNGFLTVKLHIWRFAK